MTTPEQVERELRELEMLLTEDAPEPSPAFSHRMEERLAHGFPRRRRLPALSSMRLAHLPPLSGVRLPRLPRPALAGLASAALALSVTAALLAGGERGEDGDRTAVAPSAPTGDEPARGLAAPGSAELGALADETDSARSSQPPRGDESIAPGERERDIERSAELTLAAPGDELGQAADEVVAVADRHRGFVLRSEIRTDDGGGGGQFELRIPQERLRAALRDLSAIGEVRARSEQGQDVTPVVSRTEERLDEARAERRGLLRRLERAQTDEQSRAIRRRLRLASAEIRRLSGELARLRERVNYAAVAVTLEEGGESHGSAGGGGAGEALDDALGTLEGALELGIRALGVLVPLSLLAAAAWLASRAVLRRRREGALG